MYVNLNKVERLKDAIENIHGSGINYDYQFKVGYTRKYGMVLKAMNGYDIMDENGLYNGLVLFTIKVPVENPEDFVLMLHARYHDSDGLKDYLESLYADVLVK